MKQAALRGPSLRPGRPDFADHVRDSFGRQRFMAYLGAEIVDVRPGACDIALDFRPELGQ